MNPHKPIGPQSLPLEVFDEWMKEAQAQPNIREATAMTVATVGQDLTVHARIVLCKHWSVEGFKFYSNYQSRKGLDLLHNPIAALVFYWDPMFRQVKISGPVSRTTRDDSVEYWRSRPRASQLSQYISRQSQAATSRATMEQERDAVESEFHGREIPCPEHWGGYILKPERIEFWVGQEGRLHDRYEFEKTSTLWTFRRLYP